MLLISKISYRKDIKIIEKTMNNFLCIFNQTIIHGKYKKKIFKNIKLHLHIILTNGTVYWILGSSID